jgi:hypothetical protein
MSARAIMNLARVDIELNHSNHTHNSGRTAKNSWKTTLNVVAPNA